MRCLAEQLAKPQPVVDWWEALLFEHPAIADCAVVPRTDADAGEIPCAFVVARAGASLTEVELMQFVAGRVAGYKQIRAVEFIDAIPRNPSGKILRRVLRDRERAAGEGGGGRGR